MNSKNQSTYRSKKHPVDKFVKRNLETLDFTPPPLKYWTKSKSWKTIKSRIEGLDSKAVAWGMALAATVSLTLAAGLHLNLSSLFDDATHLGDTHNTIATSTNKEPDSFNKEFVKPIIVLDELKPLEKDLITPKEQKLLFKAPAPSSNLLIQDYKKGANRATLQHILNPYFSVGTNAGNFDTEIGIDFLIYSIEKNFKSKQFKIGASTELIQLRDENNIDNNLYHFVNLSYENIDQRSNKGWSIKSGLLINPDSNYYQNSTVRLGLNRHFNKWIKLGPELIFTNNWKNIYPAITLTMG